ncbi:MAG: hypothetical protein NTW17_02920 [Candidatus Pacearchaeota archaeon]|nr:hypothetical protein [Candidatus Pacearchaeota archaeon]
MLNKLYEFIAGPLTDFLRKSYINNGIFFMDNYTFLHLAGGFLIMLLLFLFFKRLKLRYKFFIIFLLAVGWEILEVIVPLFSLDSWVNRIWDIIAEMLGGLLFLGIKKIFRRRTNEKP